MVLFHLVRIHRKGEIKRVGLRQTGFENAGEDHDRLLRAGSDNLVTYFCASLVPDFS